MSWIVVSLAIVAVIALRRWNRTALARDDEQVSLVAVPTCRVPLGPSPQ